MTKKTLKTTNTNVKLHFQVEGKQEAENEQKIIVQTIPEHLFQLTICFCFPFSQRYRNFT